MNKLLFFFLLFYLHVANVYSDIIKPNTKIEPYNVVEIQLISLKNNDKPDKDFGIEQTWEFAHPENKINTGPLNNFKKMLKNEIYSILLNHKDHKIEEIYNRTLYKNNSPFGGDKISVYSENEKKMLIESGLVSAQQVIVTGCARLDLAFGYKNTEIGNSTILYYMIEKERSIPGRKHFVSWSNLKLETEKYLIDYAKKNPQKKIIFKGKVGVHTRSELPKKLPKNCLYIGNSPGHELLKLSNVVVCFNSTVLYEAIAAKKNLIIPFFNLNFSELEEHLLVIPNSIDLIKNHQEFYEKLDLYTSKNILKKILDNSEKEVLGFYFGNTDGNSGSRTKLFLENAMFN